MKNYRILRFAEKWAYPTLDRFSVQYPDYHEMPYDELYQKYAAMKYIHSNAFVNCMQRLGNEAREYIYDFKILQKKWAVEKGVRYRDDNWAVDIMLHQIQDYKPDVLHLFEIGSLPDKIRKNLKSLFPFIKLFIVQKGFPDRFDELKDVDIVFTCTPKMVVDFRKQGIKAELFYHYFDESILDDLKPRTSSPANHQFDFVFAGTSGYGFGWTHRTRFTYLAELMKSTALQSWIYEYNLVPDENEKPLGEVFPDKTHPPVFGLDMYRLFQSSKIVFNLHTDGAYGNVGNMRLFEATGVGSCILTDSGDNMTDLFQNDIEVATYSSVAECIEKLNYLLQHDELRKEIAMKGQQRTLKDHTAMNRCIKMDSILQKKF